MNYASRHVLVASALFFLFFTSPLKAQEPGSLRNGVLLLPLQADKGVPAHKAYLGIALQNVLENVLSLHSNLEESWANWYQGQLFPQETDYQNWVSGQSATPSAVKATGLRYLITGVVDLQDDRVRVQLVLLDRARGKTFSKELVVDPPVLEEFRNGFLSLLDQAGLAPLVGQKAKMLWKEDISLEALSLMGHGLYEDIATTIYPQRGGTYQVKSFEDGLRLAPRSYLLLNNLGWVLLRQKKYLEADKSFEQALAINATGVDATDGKVQVAEQTGDEKLAEIWVGRKAKLQGKDLRSALMQMWSTRAGEAYARRNFSKAAVDLKQALPLARATNNKAAEGSILISLGENLDEAFRFDEAAEYLEQALTVNRELKNAQGELLALSKLGDTYLVLGRDESVRIYEKGLALARQLKDQQSENVFLIRLGRAYVRSTHIDKAISILEESLALARLIKDRVSEAEALSILGDIYLNKLLRFDKALESFTRALSIYVELRDLERQEVMWEQLGSSFASLGQYDQALNAFQQARSQARTANNRAMETVSLTSLALFYFSRKQYDKAIETYEQQVAMARELNNSSIEAMALLGIGSSYLFSNQNEKAIAFLQQSLLKVRTTKNQTLESLALFRLGQIYMQTGQYDKAAEYLEKCAFLSRGNQLRDMEAAALYLLMVRWQTSDNQSLSQRARSSMLSTAIFYGKQAVNIYQDIRSDMQRVEKQSQLTFLKPKEGAYRMLADLLISEGRLLEARQVLDLLKEEEYSQFVRGGSKTNIGLRLDLTPAEAAENKKSREISDQLTALSREYAELSSKDELTATEKQRLVVLQDELAAANQKFKTFLNELYVEMGGSNNRLAEKSTEQVKDESKAIQQLLDKLGPGVVALYTLVTEDKYHVIVITPNVTIAHEYSIKREELRAKVFAFQETLRRPGHDPLPEAQELYRILIGPIAKELEGAKAETLMWSLDGVLRYIPMSALHDGKQYMVERFRNVIINPVSFGHLTDEPKSAWRGLAMGVSKSHEGLSELLNVPGELRAVVNEEGSQLESGAVPGKLMLDDAFTEESMISALRNKYPLVHIASHFVIQPASATTSYLLMGDGSHLTLEHLSNLPSPFAGVDLLTLSACDTGMGDTLADGREVDSLGRVAQDGGARAVIASLWEINDKSTKLLMHKFYQLRETQPGTTKAEALREAQLSLLRGDDQASHLDSDRGSGPPVSSESKTGSRPPYSHPFYWAPFILIGNWK